MKRVLAATLIDIAVAAVLTASSFLQAVSVHASGDERISIVEAWGRSSEMHRV
ncbi:hypothetical protein KEU06_05755 [Pseudaminobacter sp. 19-2017]|uniref:Uncharacterized protein n=1 Tax=Pseudaminobacter soli (ex Zhang et al. 2022) TaxID=2831468 RepID=A0A942E433_9HYPH|nr:hypothetical protein [Pseudaminobacter soli]MBS3648132.1 hypothetical protein [Pseudaminobacter soli]